MRRNTPLPIAGRVMVAASAMLGLPALAQSSVTLFGVVDTTAQIGTGSGAGSASRRQLTHSGLAASRLGFRGSEDLGGGLTASFWLEAGVNTDDGKGAATNTNNQGTGGAPSCAVTTTTTTTSTASPAVAGTAITSSSTSTSACSTAINGGQGLLFNRRSTVSLSGPWGEARLGRDFTPWFRNLTVFDPFETNGTGTALTLNGATSSASGAPSLNILGAAAVRASNSIGYFLPPNIGGFYGELKYFFGENARNGAATENDGTGSGIRVGWQSQGFNVAVSYGRVDYARTATAGDVSVWNVGGSADVGPVRLMGHLSRDKVDTLTGLKGSGALLGVIWTVGSGEVKAALSRYKVDQVGNDPVARKIAVGYVHHLSKRTALYATYARIRNSGSANATLGNAITAANNPSSGLDLGLRHSF